jgi:hypothetical protein
MYELTWLNIIPKRQLYLYNLSSFICFFGSFAYILIYHDLHVFVICLCFRRQIMAWWDYDFMVFLRSVVGAFDVKWLSAY